MRSERLKSNPVAMKACPIQTPSPGNAGSFFVLLLLHVEGKVPSHQDSGEVGEYEGELGDHFGETLGAPDGLVGL